MLLAKKLTAEEFVNARFGLKKPLWLVKLQHFEYWPMWLIYIPIAPYLIWLMLKCRSFHFYKYVNPSIKNGGLAGESKKLIMDDIIADYKPLTFLFSSDISFNELKLKLLESRLIFPLIAKPDIGEQGKDVEKITNWSALEFYLNKSTVDFIIQEYIDYPIELAVFYSKYPGDKNGHVTSVTKKVFLSVTGDGILSIAGLILKSERARFQLKRLSNALADKINYIPEIGEKITLEVIGNHCKGTMFLDGSDLIDDRLNLVFNKISENIPGFYFGRYDLRVSSIEDLYNGNNIRIVELNGVGAIPAHIFDPEYKLVRAWKDILFHWRIAGKTALINKKAKVRIFGQN